MRRPWLLLTFFIGLGFIVAACAAPLAAPGETVEDDPSTPGAQTDPPTGPPAGDDDGSADDGSADDGSGDTGEAPALADGPWTGGQGQITVGGAVQHTVDAPLTTERSDTTDAKTRLAYNPPDGFVTIFINFIGVPFHASVDTNDFSVSSEDCEVTYDRADDTGIDATFRCVVDELHWYSVEDEPTGEITIEGSFTATR